MSNNQYKLTYFNLRGRGELIRWIFAVSGLNWQDERISFSDWQNVKPKIPGGQLPHVTTPEGKSLTQSVAIARYVAKKGGLVPDDDYEAFQCDKIVDTLASDLMTHFVRLLPMKPKEEVEAGVENWNKEAGPKFLKTFNDWVKESKTEFLVGDKLSWADLAIAMQVDSIQRIESIKDSLNDYPELTQFADKIKQSGKLQDYLKERPDGDMNF